MKNYVGISSLEPEVGKPYICARVEIYNGYPKLVDVTTSVVKDVRWEEPNLARVTTENSVYYVKVV